MIARSNMFPMEGVVVNDLTRDIINIIYVSDITNVLDQCLYHRIHCFYRGKAYVSLSHLLTLAH